MLIKKYRVINLEALWRHIANKLSTNLEADLTNDHIRPTFEKLIDAHLSLPTRALRVY